jgi:hypothetical protein
LDTAGHGFRLAVKYFLPKLLASPIQHAFLYFDYVAMLLKLAPYTEDMESFQQVLSYKKIRFDITFDPPPFEIFGMLHIKCFSFKP